MNQKMLPIAAILTAAALTGILSTAPMTVYADESETSTDQSVKQKNVGSGDSLNFNCAENLIKAGVGEQACGQEDEGIIAPCLVCGMGAIQPNPLFGSGQ
jgi:hypothetical protein